MGGSLPGKATMTIIIIINVTTLTVNNKVGTLDKMTPTTTTKTTQTTNVMIPTTNATTQTPNNATNHNAMTQTINNVPLMEGGATEIGVMVLIAGPVAGVLAAIPEAAATRIGIMWIVRVAVNLRSRLMEIGVLTN